MPYLPSIPIGSQTLKSSQPQIKANFEALNTIFGAEHSDYTVAAGNSVGKHKKLTLLGNLPVPVATASQMVLYDKITSGSSELWMKRDGFATEYQLTSGGYPTTNPTGLQIRAAVRFARLTGVITYSFNVSSISVSDPNYQINFTSALSTANYYPSVLVEGTTPTAFACNGNSGGRTTTGYGVIIGGGNFVQVVIFGT